MPAQWILKDRNGTSNRSQKLKLLNTGAEHLDYQTGNDSIPSCCIIPDKQDHQDIFHVLGIFWKKFRKKLMKPE